MSRKSGDVAISPSVAAEVVEIQMIHSSVYFMVCNSTRMNVQDPGLYIYIYSTPLWYAFHTVHSEIYSFTWEKQTVGQA